MINELSPPWNLLDEKLCRVWFNIFWYFLIWLWNKHKCLEKCLAFCLWWIVQWLLSEILLLIFSAIISWSTINTIHLFPGLLFINVVEILHITWVYSMENFGSLKCLRPTFCACFLVLCFSFFEVLIFYFIWMDL